MSGSPENAAREARRDLSLGADGPVSDLLQRIEIGDGVNVVLAKLPEGALAGAYTRERDVPFILVNSREPVVRQRFTLAHEYGHHRLGHGSVCDERIWWGATDAREVAANRFAAEFLVPVAGVDLWFQAEQPDSVGLETLVRLANSFGVSCETALWRIKAARRMSASAADRLKRRLDAHEHHGLRSELGLSAIVDTISMSQGLEVRVPSRMSSDVVKALEFGIITREQAAEKLRLTVSQLDIALEDRSRAQEDE